MASPWHNSQSEIQACLDLGCEVVLTRKSHFKVTYEGKFVGTLAGTPHSEKAGLARLSHIRRNIARIQEKGNTL